MILFFHEFKFGLNDCLFYAGLLNIIFIFVLTIIIISSVSMRQLNILSNLKIHLKSFMRSGLEFQGLSIINNSFFPIVNIFINNSFGLSSVSYFDIAIKLLRSGRQIIVAATEPFFGKITQLANQNKRLLIKLLIVRYTKYVGMLSVIYLFSNIVFSKFILNIWMGPDVALKTVMLVNIVAFGMAVNISSSVVYNSFIAQKKYRIYIFYHQLILLILALIPFSLKLDSLLQYSYYYSAAFVSSSIYIMYIFYKKYGY
jgi:O-antigen/teichoic acid export membrane protein